MWSALGKTNIWGVVPDVVEMQIGRWSGGGGPRLAPGGRADHHLHRFTGLCC